MIIRSWIVSLTVADPLNMSLSLETTICGIGSGWQSSSFGFPEFCLILVRSFQASGPPIVVWSGLLKKRTFLLDQHSNYQKKLSKFPETLIKSRETHGLTIFIPSAKIGIKSSVIQGSQRSSSSSLCLNSFAT